MAAIEPRRCTARDGQAFVVRVAEDADAAAVLAVSAETIAEGRRRDEVRREDGSLVDDVLMAWFPQGAGASA